MPTAEDLLNGQRAAVIEGDCLEILPTLTGQIDHFIFDPPYEAEAHTLQRRIKRDGGGVLSVEPLDFAPMVEADRVAVGAQVARLVRRWSLVFCQVEAAMLWRDSLKPLDYVRTQIWVKTDPQPQLTGDRPGMGYESIVTCHPSGRKHWNGGGLVGTYTYAKNPPGRTYEHPTEKPMQLMRELIEKFTSPNDLILDPFSGSATTAIAALRLGRRALCIERDPKYAQLSRDRIQAELSSSTLQAHRAGQLPLLR